ncbi:hypothetical protein EAG21025_43850 (plasmid) [Enterobacter asburiae]|uniref:hypothetical protein n=1 Tax=Enterobacter asburiae TaxID=61645 RepID=UPI0034E8C116|nr:hypothetical protein [Enterobacter asburiae]
MKIQFLSFLFIVFPFSVAGSQTQLTTNPDTSQILTVSKESSRLTLDVKINEYALYEGYHYQLKIGEISLHSSSTEFLAIKVPFTEYQSPDINGESFEFILTGKNGSDLRLLTFSPYINVNSFYDNDGWMIATEPMQDLKIALVAWSYIFADTYTLSIEAAIFNL